MEESVVENQFKKNDFLKKQGPNIGLIKYLQYRYSTNSNSLIDNANDRENYKKLDSQNEHIAYTCIGSEEQILTSYGREYASLHHNITVFLKSFPFLYQVLRNVKAIKREASYYPSSKI